MSPRSKPPGTSVSTDPPLPATREELLALHRAARRRRDAAELGSPDFTRAAEEVSRIEVQIARTETAIEPPPA